MADEKKVIKIRNVNTGTETTMLADRFRARISRMTSQGWVVVDADELGIKVEKPAPLTVEEKIEQAKVEMGVTDESKLETVFTIEENEPQEPVILEELSLSELKEKADELGIDYPKNAGKKKMLQILNNQ